MAFSLLPAVDVTRGRPVHLSPDGADSGPALVRSTALAFQADGADWIHLVDLDAAHDRGSNASLLAAVIGELDIDVELAGGIRDDASLRRALATGCTRVSLATAALQDRTWCERAIHEHRERIAVSLDVRVCEQADGAVSHHLAARGTSDALGDLWDVVEWLERAGCARYIITDVDRDGALSGPTIDLYRAVARATATHVIASGGVASIDDLRVLAHDVASETTVDGAIVGKALHTGRFTLPAALDATRRNTDHV